MKRGWVVAVTALLTITVVAVTAFAINRGKNSSEPAAIVEDNSSFLGSERTPAPPVKSFRLSSYRGSDIQLPREGRVTVLAFLYSTCEDTCPFEARLIDKSLQQLNRESREDVDAIAISVDPKADSPASVRKFLYKNRVTGTIDYLIGSANELRPVWRQFGVRSGVQHSPAILLIDRKGRQRVGYNANITTPSEIAHDIELLVNGQP